MAEPLFGLTAADVTKLRQLLDYVQKQGVNFGRASRLEDDPPAPETYVALVPDTGIPGRSGLTPGSAECTVFAVRTRDTTPALDETGKTVLVINVSESSIEASGTADLYVPVTRDKFGTWLVTGIGNDLTDSLDALIDICPIVNGYGYVTGFRKTFRRGDKSTYCEDSTTCPPDGCGTVWYCVDGTPTEVDVGDPVPTGTTVTGPYRTEGEAYEACPLPALVVDCSGTEYEFPGSLVCSAVNPTGCLDSNAMASDVEPGPNAPDFSPVCCGAYAEFEVGANGTGMSLAGDEDCDAGAGDLFGVDFGLTVWWCVDTVSPPGMVLNIVGGANFVEAGAESKKFKFTSLLDGTWTFTPGGGGFTASKTFAGTDHTTVGPLAVALLEVMTIDEATTFGSVDIYLQ